MSLEAAKINNESNQIPKPNNIKNASGSSAQEMDKRFLLECESTDVRTGRLVFQLCASVC